MHHQNYKIVLDKQINKNQIHKKKTRSLITVYTFLHNKQINKYVNS